MTTYLLSIGLGPVQEFIAAGRKTNDLLAGSWLISEATRTAAKAITEAGGELIFPDPSSLGSAQAIPNKILAVVASNPREAATKAETEAKTWLRGQWEKSLNDLNGQRSHVAEELARQQIDTFLEFYAAWWPWDGQPGKSYQVARREVELLLAGRKALRDFKQPQKNPGVHKSSLDPSRDSVVSTPATCASAPLRLKANEYVDALSVLKRVQGYGIEVPSTSDIAARTHEAKLAAGSDDGNDELTRLRECARAGWMGNLVYASRRKEIAEDIEENRASKRERDEASKLSAAFPGEQGIREADPYYAILVADGDRMGELIGRMKSPEDHRKLSRQLAEFAGGVSAVVAQYEGHVVYSGGDDVLALLPTHTCVACAGQLAKEFATRVPGASLSVGVAIVHYHDPLQVGLRFAREAEAAAKNKSAPPQERGNRLVLAFHMRGGQKREAVWKWPDGYDFAARAGSRQAGWRTWIEAFDKGLTRGLPYELELLAREADGTTLQIELLRQEALRIFERKEKFGDSVKYAGKDEMKAAIEGIASADGLRKLAQELVVFRKLSGYQLIWEAKS